jgi:hypothetical protein
VQPDCDSAASAGRGHGHHLEGRKQIMALLSAQGPVGFPGGTSVVFTTPYPLQAGARGTDAAGNEYVFCNFSSTVNAGQPVAIGSDFSASILAVTGRGPVGVACARATSDQAGWVQIYGRCVMQIIASGVSPSDDANGPTTLGTSAGTVFVLPTSITSPMALAWVSGNTSVASRVEIEGMSVATDASVSNSVTATTATTSDSGAHTGHEVAVFLNYPNARHRNYGE